MDEIVSNTNNSNFSKEIKKILILGSNGRVGTKLIDYSLKKGYEPIGIDFSVEPINKDIGEFDYYSVDLQQVHPLMSAILGASPDVVFFVAGINDIDFCEAEQELAYSINVGTVNTIVKIASEMEIKVVFLSCAQVFDGKKEGPYLETDVPSPVNFYGKTKLEAEELVSSLSSSLIIRDSQHFCSPLVKNGLFMGILDKLKNGGEVTFPVDNMMSPISIDFLVESMFYLLENGASGIFHLAGPEILSEYEFALKIAEVFELKKESIKGIPLEKFSYFATRPRNYSLSAQKFLDFSQKSLFTLEESLKYCKILYFDNN